MSGAVKLPRLVFFHSSLLSSRQNLITTARPFAHCCKMTFGNTLQKLDCKSTYAVMIEVSRGKSTKRKNTHKKEEFHDDSDEDDDEKDSDEESDFNFKGDEMKTFETPAPRVDKILKLCFKMSRKNIEDLFYQTKVRINGKILKKKSANTNIGDEIDIINGFVNDNPKLINISKIEILNIKLDSDSLNYNVKVKKSKSLIVQNYSGTDEWRG